MGMSPWTVRSMDAIERSLCKIWKNLPRMLNFLQYSNVCFHSFYGIRKHQFKGWGYSTAEDLGAALGPTNKNNNTFSTKEQKMYANSLLRVHPGIYQSWLGTFTGCSLRGFWVEPIID